MVKVLVLTSLAFFPQGEEFATFTFHNKHGCEPAVLARGSYRDRTVANQNALLTSNRWESEFWGRKRCELHQNEDCQTYPEQGAQMVGAFEENENEGTMVTLAAEQEDVKEYR